MNGEPKGPKAARLRQRKFEILRRLRIPEDAVGGSLALTRTRCGKPTCRCAHDEPHDGWQLTFSSGGKKRVERVPRDWAEAVQRQVEIGKTFRGAVAEVFTINAELLALARTQRGR